jgi:hypothetical protein
MWRPGHVNALLSFPRLSMRSTVDGAAPARHRSPRAGPLALARILLLRSGSATRLASVSLTAD